MNITMVEESYHARQKRMYPWFTHSFQDRVRYQVRNAMSEVQAPKSRWHTRIIISGTGRRRLMVVVDRVPYDIDGMKKDTFHYAKILTKIWEGDSMSAFSRGKAKLEAPVS